MKKNLTYKVLNSTTYVNPKGLMTHTDQHIIFEKGDLRHTSRRVELWSYNKKKSVVLLTNNFDLPVEDIEEELRPVKSEIRTDKLKSATTNAATAIASGVGSLFGSGKMKELERTNEKLQDEVSKRDTNIEKLQTQIQQMQKQHDTQIHNLREMHRQELDMKEKKSRGFKL